MSEPLPELPTLNTTELLNIIRRQTGMIVKRSVEREWLLQIIEYGDPPAPHEVADTMETRRRLQVFVEKSWDWLNSQLPCKGEKRGKCTIYPCPDARHLDCYMAAQKQDI